MLHVRLLTRCCDTPDLLPRLRCDRRLVPAPSDSKAPDATSWMPPRYAAPVRFTEREVTVGSGPLAVPGTRQAARVDSAGLSPATPAADLLFGWPAAYWLDLRE